MVDIVDSPTRSRMMSGIRARNTKPEIRLRKALHRLGFRYLLHPRDIPGRPDIALPRFRATIFVHGCFWHRHPGCRFATNPASNVEFWQKKFTDNLTRDQRSLAALSQSDWRTAIVWECSIRERGGESVAAEVAAWLQTDQTFLEI